jgi:hypothetical protein
MDFSAQNTASNLSDLCSQPTFLNVISKLTCFKLEHTIETDNDIKRLHFVFTEPCGSPAPKSSTFTPSWRQPVEIKHPTQFLQPVVSLHSHKSNSTKPLISSHSVPSAPSPKMYKSPREVYTRDLSNFEIYSAIDFCSPFAQQSILHKQFTRSSLSSTKLTCICVLNVLPFQ